MELTKPVCKVCAEEVAPGTLLSHTRAAHPEPTVVAKRGYVCRAAKCVDYYGRGGHIVGLEGPHVH